MTAPAADRAPAREQGCEEQAPGNPPREATWGSAAGVLVILAWAFVVVPRFVQSLTASKYRTTVGVEDVPYSALATLAELGLLAALAGWCALVLLQRLRLRRLPTARLPQLALLLAPWAYLVVRDLYAGRLPGPSGVLYPLVVLALWALRPRLAVLSVLGHLVGATAVLSLLMGAALPEKGVYRTVTGALIAPEKQILPWGILVGPFTHGNNLAQFLVIGLPALGLVRSRGARAGLLAATVLALVWTSSRSSLGALAACAVLALALVVAAVPARRALSALALTGVGGVVVLLPLLTRTDGAFTNRGYVWRLSLQEWALSPVTGRGSRFYSELAQYANSLGGSAHHGHNQLVHALVTGGLLYAAALVVLGVALVAAASRWAGGGAAYPTAFTAALLVSCTFEVSFGVLDREFLLAVTAVPLAVLLCGQQPAPPELPAGAA